MKSSYSSHDVKVIVNGLQMKTVSAVNTNFSVDYESVDILGVGSKCYIPNKQSTNRLSFDRFVTNEEPVRNWLDSPINGGLKYGEWGSFSHNLEFTSGYLSSYSVGASVGGYPTCSTTFDIYGEMRYTNTLACTGNFGDDADFIDNGGIIVTASDVQYDNIQSISMSFEVPRRKSYGVFSSYPTLEEIAWPLTLSLNLTVDLDEFQHPNVRTFFSQQLPSSNITLQLKPYRNDGSDQTSVTYTIPAPKIQSVSYRLNAQDTMQASIDYISYINSFDNLIGDPITA